MARKLSLRTRIVLAIVLGIAGLAAWTPAAQALVPPLNILPPSISGSPQEGQTVTCSPGTWSPVDPPTSYSYTWHRDGTNIGGATSSTYGLTSDDVTHLITCTVVANNSSGDSLPAISAPIVPTNLPPVGPPVDVTQPSISGSAEEGQTVTCSSGTWLNSPTSYTYTWQRDAGNIGGATSASYKLTSADNNHLITCSVVAHNSSGDSAPAISVPIAPTSLPIGGQPIDVLPPSISGSAQEGQTVTCSPGTWLNSPTSYAYTWQRDASNIGGATSASYKLTSADNNHLITCSVVAHNANGDSAPAISVAIVPVALPVGLQPTNLTPPAIAGTAKAGKTVSCSTGTWLNSPTTYQYAWQRNTTAISGATSANYTLRSADVTRLITCTVIAHNGSGDSVPAISLPIVPAAGGSPGSKPVNLILPSISGTAQQGRTLGCRHGTWRNAPSSFSYRWRRGPRTVSRARTYKLGNADVGRAISCTVVATNAKGNGLPAISLPAIPLPSIPHPTLAPKISGSPEAYHQLTCSAGSWTPVPTAFAYRWLRNGTKLPGVGTKTYTVKLADLGQHLQCRVLASNTAGARAATSRAVVPSDKTTPAVTSFGLTNKQFSLGPKPGAAKSPVGTAFEYKLSEPAEVTVRIERKRFGYRKHGKCLRLNAKLRHKIHRKVRHRIAGHHHHHLTHAKRRHLRKRIHRAYRSNLRHHRCPRFQSKGELEQTGSAGANKLSFSGWIGDRALKAGKYRATIVATDAGRNTSAPERARFQVVTR